jgi:hypothetical protein
MNRNRNQWALRIAVGAILAAPLPGWPQESAPAGGKNGNMTVEAKVVIGTRYDSSQRRDPFLNPLLLRKKVDELNEEVSLGQPPPGISGMYISEVTLAGVSLRDDGKTAVFKGQDKRAYFLQEGDRLFDGYLRKIEPDSVVLVRETKLKSGKLITEEVQKRLRTP